MVHSYLDVLLQEGPRNGPLRSEEGARPDRHGSVRRQQHAIVYAVSGRRFKEFSLHTKAAENNMTGEAAFVVRMDEVGHGCRSPVWCERGTYILLAVLVHPIFLRRTCGKEGDGDIILCDSFLATQKRSSNTRKFNTMRQRQTMTTFLHVRLARAREQIQLELAFCAGL